MSTHNAPSRVPGLRDRKFDLAVFDSMPRHLKEICWYAQNPVPISRPNPNSDYAAARRIMAEGERKNTLLTYGPDHPQAGLPAGGVQPLSRGACHPDKREGTDQMKTYAFDFTKQSIKAYESKQEARNAGNGTHLASTAEEFLEFRVTAHEIVALYNRLVPDAPVQKFQDKATAAKRMIALAEAKAQLVAAAPATPAGDVQKENDEMAKSAARSQKQAVKVSKPKKEGATGRGRTSEFAGKRITATVEENPRREGTFGHASMALVLKKPGIAYEDYIAAGGRRQDLAWDLEHKWVKIS